jgi:cytidine deaminase
MLLIHLGFALNAAIFQAGAIYPQAKILKMAITAASDTSNYDSHTSMRCMQTIAEYETKQDTHSNIFYGELGDIYKSESLKNLLPLCLTKNFL